MSPKEQIIYDMFVAAAEHGDPAPANTVLSTAIGTSSIAAPVQYVNNLIGKGYITVQRTRCSRTVTIVATGKSTRSSINKRLAAYEKQAAAQRDRLAELVSEGMLLKDAAALMGVSDKRVHQVWKQIKDGLGWLG